MKVLDKLLGDLETIEREYQCIYETILECRAAAVKQTNEEVVDACYVLKRMSKFCDDLRKEMNRIRESLERIVCLRWIQESLSQDISDVELTIYGKLASAVPTIKTMTSLPNKDKNPEAYVKFMKKIGVSSVALSEGLTKLHWPSVVGYLTSLTEKGEPLPEGLDSSSSYQLYSLVMRKVKHGKKETNSED